MFSLWEEHLFWICTDTCERRPDSEWPHLSKLSLQWSPMDLFLKWVPKPACIRKRNGGCCSSRSLQVFPSRKCLHHQVCRGFTERNIWISLTLCLCTASNELWLLISQVTRWLASLAFPLGKPAPGKIPSLCSQNRQRSLHVFGELHSYWEVIRSVDLPVIKITNPKSFPRYSSLGSLQGVGIW